MFESLFEQKWIHILWSQTRSGPDHPSVIEARDFHRFPNCPKVELFLSQMTESKEYSPLSNSSPYATLFVGETYSSTCLR